MKKFDAKKEVIIENIADYILKNGIKNASLRNIAYAISISNRMLLHYFKDKEEMMTEALTHITKNFLSIIENVKLEKMSLSSLIPYLYHILKATGINLYIQLFLELISFSAEQNEPYSSIAGKIGEIFYNWIENSIIINNDENKEEKISFTFAIIEGIVILNALHYDEKIEKALSYIAKKL